MKHTIVGTRVGGSTSTVEDMVLFLKGIKDVKILNSPTNNALLNHTYDCLYGYGTEHHIID